MEDKGSYWMSLGGFCYHFNIVEICRVHPSYKYSSVKLDHNELEENNKFSVVRITVLEKNHGYLRLIQRSRRHLRKYIPEYTFSKTKIFLAKIKGNEELTWESGRYQADHSLEIELELEAG